MIYYERIVRVIIIVTNKIKTNVLSKQNDSFTKHSIENRRVFRFSFLLSTDYSNT